MFKRIIQIILILLIIAALAFVVWIIFFRESSSQTSSFESSNPDNIKENLEQSNQRLKRIQNTERAAINSITSEAFLAINAEFLTLIDTKEGAEKEIAPSPFFTDILGFEAQSEESILIHSSDSFEENFHIFNPETNSWIELNDTVTSATLSPDGLKLATFSESEGKLEILDYSSQETIASHSLNLIDIEISWSREDLILFHSNPSQETEGILLTFNLENQNIEKIAEAPGLSFIFNQNMESFLILDNSPLRGPSLKLQKGDQTQNLSFTTFPEKCIFNNSATLFCAIPSSTEQVENLPDSYLQNSKYTSDGLFRLDIFDSSSSLNPLLSKEEINVPIDAKNLEFINNALYFINRYDNQLYELSLE